LKNIVIFHYHYLPGGVTDVVTSAVISYLQNSSIVDDIRIVSGRKDNLDKLLTKILNTAGKDKTKRIQFDYLPSIDYLENLSENDTAETIKNELLNKYKSDKSIWWIHNYHLGKNPYFTKALLEISHSENQKMVFHIHDFPECSRYALLNRLKTHIKEDLYPQNSNIHYAVINARDYHYLRAAGIQREMITLLENPICPVTLEKGNRQNTYDKLTDSFSRTFPSWEAKSPYMLYPVRAIRRKNIAEAALIAILTDKNIIITLPGVSDAEKQYSEKCEKIFTDGLSPGIFGIGYAIDDLGISFEQLISSSSMIVSTSVQEGFGYLFLNSLNWGKPLFAKDLDILDSFKDSFKGFPSSFYDHFKIHLNKEEKELLIESYRIKIESLNRQTKLSSKSELLYKFTQIIDKKYTDFSYLSLNMQISILNKLKKNKRFLQNCRRYNGTHIKKINSYFKLDISPEHHILEKSWSFLSYCRKTEKILLKLEKNDEYTVKKASGLSTCETLQNYFASPEYLRLIYDE